MPSSRVTSEIRRLSVPAEVGFTIVGATSQSGDLTQWQNASGTVLAKVDSSGNIYVPILQSTTASTATLTTNGDTGGLLISTVAAANKGLVVKGFTSQSANLQEWQDSSGTVKAYVTSSGLIYSATTVGSTYFTDGGSTRPYIDFTTANKLIINARTSTYVALTVDGVASQSGDLQQWRNNSGTVLARTTAAGAITSAGATAGIGYETGAGSTATQGSGSGKSTAVTLNFVTGNITMNNAALNAATVVSFTLTNSAIAAQDMVLVQHVGTGTLGAYTCTAVPAAGSATIYVRNNSASNLSEAIVLKYVVIKAVTA